MFWSGSKLHTTQKGNTLESAKIRAASHCREFCNPGRSLEVHADQGQQKNKPEMHMDTVSMLKYTLLWWEAACGIPGRPLERHGTRQNGGVAEDLHFFHGAPATLPLRKACWDSSRPCRPCRHASPPCSSEVLNQVSSSADGISSSRGR